MVDKLIDRANLALGRLEIGVTIEEITRKPNLITYPATEQLVDRHAEFFSNDVQAGELQSRVLLRAVVIERGRRIADRIAHPVEVERIVSNQVGFQSCKG